MLTYMMLFNKILFHLMACAIIYCATMQDDLLTTGARNATRAKHQSISLIMSVIAVSIFICQPMPLGLRLPSGRLAQGTSSFGLFALHLTESSLMLRMLLFVPFRNTSIPIRCRLLVPLWLHFTTQTLLFHGKKAAKTTKKPSNESFFAILIRRSTVFSIFL